jgi:Leucine-rich repeat (LRR) protein
LTDLCLHYNQISDITPLAGLTNLTVLDLAGNQISDLTPLAKLINLTILDLDDNQISDPKPLEGLTNLTWLGLYRNPVTRQQVDALKRALPKLPWWFGSNPAGETIRIIVLCKADYRPVLAEGGFG